MKNKNKKGVSIIIASFNTRNLLQACINSILRFTKDIEYEVIVIDNASSDGSIKYLKKEKNKNIRVIFNKKNIGFGPANNQGIKEAKFDYLLFLNSDTLIKDNVIKKMTEYIDSDKTIGCVSCSLENSDGSLQGSGGYFPSLLRVFSWMIIQDLPFIDRIIPPFHPMKSRSPFKNENFFENIHELDWVTGAFMLMRKTAVLETGFFDPDYFMYTEEVDFFFRMKKKGYKVIYNPEWSIVHLGGKSGTPGFSVLSEFEGVKTFYKKHYPSWQYPVLRLLLKIGSFGRMILFGILRGKEDFLLYAKAFSEV